MTSVKRMVAQQVFIPAGRAVVAGCLGAGFGAAGGHYVSLIFHWPAEVTVPAGALLISAYWAWKQIDKNNRFPTVAGRALSSLSRSFGTTTSIPSHFFGVEGTNTTILLKSSLDAQGEWFRLSQVDPRKMRRIAFHVCFMGGRLSHDYLDTKAGFLSRGGVGRLQDALIINKLAIEKLSRSGKRKGILLNEKGVDCMLSLARTYHPTPLERRAAVPFLKKWDVTCMVTPYIKAHSGGIYDETEVT